MSPAAAEAPVASPPLLVGLRKARIALPIDAYRRRARVAAAAAGALGAAVLGGWAWWVTASPGLAAVAGVAGGLTVFGLVHLGFALAPHLMAQSRARRIEVDLPAAVTLCYGLARGGVPLLEVIRAVADERATYGEAAREFATIARLVDVGGSDLHAALASVAESTPSDEMRRFLEGLVAILASGASPVEFLEHQVHFQLEKAESAIEADIARLGLLAETYVSGLLVLPLLLLVILTIFGAMGQASFQLVPLIGVLLVPVATGGFLFLAHLMLPPPGGRVVEVSPQPTDDAGVEVVPSPPGPAARAAGVPGHALDRWAQWADRQRTNLIGASVALGLLVFLVALAAVMAAGRPTLHTLGGAVLLGAMVGTVPVAAAHELVTRRARAIDRDLPGALTKLASLNDRGVDLLRALAIVGASSASALSREFRRLSQDVRWTGNLPGAVRRLRARVRTPQVGRVGVLFERASRATGSLRDVVDVAASDAGRRERHRSRRSQAAASYVVVVYVVYLVFLYVILTVSKLFVGGTAPGMAAMGGGGGPDPAVIRTTLLDAAVVQAVACGLVAGRLGEDAILAGVKHALLLVLAAFAAFAWGLS